MLCFNSRGGWIRSNGGVGGVGQLLGGVIISRWARTRLLVKQIKFITGKSW